MQANFKRAICPSWYRLVSEKCLAKAFLEKLKTNSNLKTKTKCVNLINI